MIEQRNTLPFNGEHSVSARKSQGRIWGQSFNFKKVLLEKIGTEGGKSSHPIFVSGEIGGSLGLTSDSPESMRKSMTPYSKLYVRLEETPFRGSLAPLHSIS